MICKGFVTSAEPFAESCEALHRRIGMNSAQVREQQPSEPLAA
jgi:hypothetical protein